MRTITLEEHFLADSFKEKMSSIATNAGKGSKTVAANALQAKLSDLGEMRLKDMDAGGIDFQVISHTASSILPSSAEESVRLARAANDQLARAISAHPDRFAGFATLPMLDPKAAAAELERAIHLPGFKGVMINGTTNGRFLDDPSFLPIFERAVALDVPIYLHPAEPPEVVRKAYYSGFDAGVNYALSAAGWGWHSEVGIHVLRLILSGLFDRLPTLQIIIGHMGEMIPFMLARINDRFIDVAKNLQQSVPEYFLQNFYITTSGFFTNPPLLLALQIMGADRIMFSVDYPYSTNEQGRAFLDHVSISPQDKEKISHLNAARVLKLKDA
ncbi:amidohydrolase [Ktedonobacteria bacterium brp13]|nr:amidohydrolase [Ktedonobacteria bacterium brp13]